MQKITAFRNTRDMDMFSNNKIRFGILKDVTYLRIIAEDRGKHYHILSIRNDDSLHLTSIVPHFSYLGCKVSKMPTKVHRKRNLHEYGQLVLPREHYFKESMIHWCLNGLNDSTNKDFG